MAIEPIHARYPFTTAARTAVDEADVDLAGVVASDESVVARGLERVEWALTEGEVGEPHRRTRVELLSYPVARVLVSLVDERVLTRKYARAEAATAHERFTEEFAATAEYKSTRGERLTQADLLAEFELTSAVRESAEGYQVGVGTYLDLAADQWGDEWRLVNRVLADGDVAVSEAELHELIRQAIRHRVADGLPLSVPNPIAEHLDEEVAQVRETLSNLDLTREIDTVVPDLFPPCMKHLLDQVQKGEHLEHHSRFAIAAFLTSIGMTTDEIVDLFQVNPGFGEDATRYQVDHIRGATSPTEYSPPSCATMQSYGDCYNKDDVCEDVIDESHPLNYYEHRLDQEDEDDLVDWREGNSDGDGEGDSAGDEAESSA
jgi:DNA primase large subunit